MALLMQSRRLTTSGVASAVRLLMSNGATAGSAASTPAHSALCSAPTHSSRSMCTAAASLCAPAHPGSALSPAAAAAAISTASSSISEWMDRISIWLAAPKSKITAHRRGQKRQHQKLKAASVMSRCPKCDRVMRQQEVVSRCPVADCPSGVSRPSAIKAQALAASQEDVAIEA